MKENLSNIIDLQKRYAKKKLGLFISMLVILTVIFGGMMVLLGIFNSLEWGMLVFLGVMYAIGFIFIGNGLWRIYKITRGKVSPALKNLTEEEQKRVNEDILSCPRIGNAVICRDGLLLVNMDVQILPYREIVFIYGRSMTYVAGVVPVSTISQISIVNKKRKEFGVNAKIKPLFGKGPYEGIDAKMFFEYMHRLAPWSFMGASKENLKLYNSHFKKMVQQVEERYEQITARS